MTKTVCRTGGTHPRLDSRVPQVGQSAPLYLLRRGTPGAHQGSRALRRMVGSDDREHGGYLGGEHLPHGRGGTRTGDAGAQECEKGRVVLPHGEKVRQQSLGEALEADAAHFDTGAQGCSSRRTLYGTATKGLSGAVCPPGP